MGRPKDRSNSEDGLLIAEIHREEEKIDRFLESRREEAEVIISEAAAESERMQQSGRKTAQREADALRERLLAESREMAEKIVLEGEVMAGGERSAMEQRSDEIVSIILRHLLGGAA